MITVCSRVSAFWSTAQSYVRSLRDTRIRVLNGQYLYRTVFASKSFNWIWCIVSKYPGKCINVIDRTLNRHR